MAPAWSATTAFMMNAGTASEIALIGLKKRLAGEVMDLNHGIAFVPSIKIKAGTYDDCSDSNIVITAGAAQRPGRLSRTSQTKYRCV